MGNLANSLSLPSFLSEESMLKSLQLKATKEKLKDGI
jgi:hypothetical protein